MNNRHWRRNYTIRHPRPRKLPNFEEVWEISVPAKNSLEWSLMLSYIMTMEAENLNQQFELLLGGKEETQEVMKKKNISNFDRNWEMICGLVRDLDSFKNQSTVFRNETLIHTFNIFNVRLNRYAEENLKQLPESPLLPDWTGRKLEAASRMLKCRIVVVYEINIDRELSFHFYPEQGDSIQYKDLIVFQYNTKPRNMFAFGIPKHNLKHGASSLEPFLIKPPRFCQLPNSEEVWEISVPARHSLPWCLVLSYIMSMKQENLDRQFELLLGVIEETQEVIKKIKISNFNRNWKKIWGSVRNFNPFKNRFSFFRDEILYAAFQIFNFRLNCFARTNLKKFPEGPSRTLEAASRMLKCRIDVYQTILDGELSCLSYPKEGQSNQYNDLIIFQYSGVFRTVNKNDVFAFGMPKQHAPLLRNRALRFILKRAKLNNEEIEDILKDLKDDFILYHLITTFREYIVPLLFKSPYIPIKLDEAAFQINPFNLQQPDGPSIFYHCFHPDAESAMNSIYDYATNNLLKSEETTRKPGDEIIFALERVSELIEKDMQLDLDVVSKTKALCMLKFNEFQRNVGKSILDIGESENNRFEKVLRELLKHYSDHFELKVENSSCSSYSNFTQYRSYYENVDSFTCLMFFDIVLKLSDDPDILSGTALSIFFTILGYKTFPMCSHARRYVPCDLSESLCGLLFVALDSRRRFFECSLEYEKELGALMELKEDGKVKNENLKKMVKKRVLDLQREIVPDIKQEIRLSRLKMYLNAAINLSEKETCAKSVQVIDRALQVVGECLTPSSEGGNFLSVLLTSSISQEMANTLIRLRNSISHIDNSSKALAKLEIEKNTLKDRTVISKLLKIFKYLDQSFEIVYKLFEFRTDMGILERSKPGARDFQEDKERGGLILNNIEMFSAKLREEKGKELTQVTLASLVYGVIKYFSTLTKKKFLKAKKLKEIETLDFLYDFLTLKKNDKDKLLEKIKIIRDKAGLSDLKEEDIKIIKRSLDEQRDIIFKFKPTNIGQYNTSAVSILKNYYNQMENSELFSDEDINSIEIFLKAELKESSKAKENICDSMNGKITTMNDDELHDKLNRILLTEKKRETIRSLCSKNPKKALKNLNELKDLHLEHFNLKNHNDLLSKLKRREFIKPMKSTSFLADLRKKLFRYFRWRGEYLIHRVENIKKILIDEDPNIKTLFEWGRGKAIKKHTRYLMCQRYLKDWEVRSSLEMLLLNCYSVLPEREDLKRIWEKAERMLSGINMRDVLAHGNAFIMTLGVHLDIEDLPTELINKMLELIDDLEAIKEMMELSEGQEDDLETVVHSKPEGDPSVKFIRKCKNWSSYISLFENKAQ